MATLQLTSSAWRMMASRRAACLDSSRSVTSKSSLLGGQSVTELRQFQTHRPLHACDMQIPRPPAVGDHFVVKQLRAVLFSEPILGASGVRPKGYMWTALAPALGWWAPYLARRAPHPLPPTPLYIAVTTVDVRLFSKPGF